MKKRNVEVLSEFISFSQKLQSGIMIANHLGIDIANIDIITDEEQNKLDEAVEILKKSRKQIESII